MLCRGRAGPCLTEPTCVYDKNGKKTVSTEGGSNVEDHASFFANIFGGEHFMDYVHWDWHGYSGYSGMFSCFLYCFFFLTSSFAARSPRRRLAAARTASPSEHTTKHARPPVPPSPLFRLAPSRPCPTPSSFAFVSPRLCLAVLPCPCTHTPHPRPRAPRGCTHPVAMPLEVCFLLFSFVFFSLTSSFAAQSLLSTLLAD